MKPAAGQIWEVPPPGIPGGCRSKTWLVRVIRVTGRHATFRKCDYTGFTKSHAAYHVVRLSEMIAPNFTLVQENTRWSMKSPSPATANGAPLSLT